MSHDSQFMARALELALKGEGATHPNPMVGCVIVRGGKIVGEGYHGAYGKNHAEVEALLKAGTRAQGATLYVNLEPCAHWGKTPPCMIAVAGAGIRRVVAAMQDPNPKVSGKGFAFLKQHGVRVQQGVLEADAKELNKAFITRITEQRPYVTLKAAMSLDGKTRTPKGESPWITRPQARQIGHQLRARVDAIATGIGTVLEDNPALTAHGQGHNPRRIIFDSRLRISLKAQVLKKTAPVYVLTTARASLAKRRALERRGVSVFVISQDKQGQVALPEAMRVLAREGITHVMLEAGDVINAAFLKNNLVDEVLWFIAPKLLSGGKTILINPMLAEKIGADLCIQGSLRRG